MPLILDQNGNKFGKSEGNALWLDEEKTSSYELYQYLINSDDSKVYEYLKVFTFLPKDEIESIMENHNAKPEERIAQKALAKEIITDIHGKESYEKALKISESLFSGNIKDLSEDEALDAFKNAPSGTFNEGEVLIDVLVNNSIASSRREAREFLSANAISINGDTVTDENFILDSTKSFNILRRGKKKYYILKMNK